MKRTVLLAAGLWCLALPSHADRVHLTGGRVVEGRVTPNGDQVIVELEAGELRLAARDVVRVETSESDVQRFERRAAELDPRDPNSLLELADFCRDHEMQDREQQLLFQLIEIAPDHAEARARLGYVRDGARWVSRDDQLRARGFVQYEGRWLSPREYQEELDAERTRRVEAALQRERARIALETRRAELEAERLRLAELEYERGLAASGGVHVFVTSDVPLYATPVESGWRVSVAADRIPDWDGYGCTSEDPWDRSFPIPGSYLWCTSGRCRAFR